MVRWWRWTSKTAAVRGLVRLIYVGLSREQPPSTRLRLGLRELPMAGVFVGHSLNLRSKNTACIYICLGQRIVCGQNQWRWVPHGRGFPSGHCYWWLSSAANAQSLHRQAEETQACQDRPGQHHKGLWNPATWVRHFTCWTAHSWPGHSR